MTEILHSRFPFDPHSPRALPGIQPETADRWLAVDEVYAGQMAERRRLLAERRAEVLWSPQSAGPAVAELYAAALAILPGLGFEVARDRVRCPDGVEVPLDPAAPLATLGALVQEDLCLLTRQGEEHVLIAAVLCFPASWKLSEKAGRPMMRIHGPVASYDADMGARVQRMLDGVRPGRPLWRFNRLWYRDADLFQPRSESEKRPGSQSAAENYLRCEKQTLMRLPQTDAVVFSIHTYVMAAADVPPPPG